MSWQPGPTPELRPPSEAEADVREFCQAHADWVVEGCYADLVQAALAFGPRLIFLDPGTARCEAHCLARPWEPHKFSSAAEQDAQLAGLLDWVRSYDRRADATSRVAHHALVDGYAGPVRTLRRPPALDASLQALWDWARTG